jgi:stearoyl-CoA desaturase (delta-9 desaturase)
MFNGLLDLPIWGLVVAALILTHITIASVTIYLHRHQAHRALNLHPVVSHFFRFWLWLTTGMRTIEWVAVHRKHHVKCETEEDPHSPQVLGIRKVMWQGAELYGLETDKPETMEKYGKGTPNDWIERKLYAPWQNYGLAVMFLIDILLFGVVGITIWAVQMIWIPFWAAGVIIGVIVITNAKTPLAISFPGVYSSAAKNCITTTIRIPLRPNYPPSGGNLT